MKISSCNVPAGRFHYEAGPVPTRFRLQVFRAGAGHSKLCWSLGHGVRAMEDIPEGELVCLYWGVYNGTSSDTDWDFRYTLW